MLLANSAADAVLETFSGLSEGASFTLAGLDFGISYVGGDGNDVALSVLRASGVPAPAPLALAALGSSRQPAAGDGRLGGTVRGGDRPR